MLTEFTEFLLYIQPGVMQSGMAFFLFSREVYTSATEGSTVVPEEVDFLEVLVTTSAVGFTHSVSPV